MRTTAACAARPAEDPGGVFPVPRAGAGGDGCGPPAMLSHLSGGWEPRAAACAADRRRGGPATVRRLGGGMHGFVRPCQSRLWGKSPGRIRTRGRGPRLTPAPDPAPASGASSPRPWRCADPSTFPFSLPPPPPLGGKPASSGPLQFLLKPDSSKGDEAGGDSPATWAAF